MRLLFRKNRKNNLLGDHLNIYTSGLSRCVQIDFAMLGQHLWGYSSLVTDIREFALYSNGYTVHVGKRDNVTPTVNWSWRIPRSIFQWNKHASPCLHSQSLSKSVDFKNACDLMLGGQGSIGYFDFLQWSHDCYLTLTSLLLKQGPLPWRLFLQMYSCVRG